MRKCTIDQTTLEDLHHQLMERDRKIQQLEHALKVTSEDLRRICFEYTFASITGNRKPIGGANA